MKQVSTKKRARRRSRGKKGRRKRVAKALAAAGAIAGGTQAYAAPMRFDNPPGPNHFEWNTSPGHEYLDILADQSSQPGGEQAVGTFERDPYVYGEKVFAIPNRIQAETVGWFMKLVGTGAGEPIPIPGVPFEVTGLIDCTYPAYAGSLLPEGEQTYLGVRFDPGDGNHYGWIGVVRTGGELDPFAWGYETDPGVPIAAGAGGGGEHVPAVTEYGLMGMGLGVLAAGAWVARKRRPQVESDPA